MDQQTMRDYAELLVDACLGIGPGARLKISGETCHRPLMLAVAEAAYERGARTVRLDYADPRFMRIFLDRARDEWIEDVSAIVSRDSETYVEEAWSLLSIMGEEDPRALEGASAERLKRMTRARSKANRPLWNATITNKIAWCVAPAPTEAWGRAVLEAAGRDPGPDPAASLWAELVPILGLDAPDPAKAARDHGETLAARARRLDELGLDSLHFKGPGTDLVVGLSPRSRWAGGGSKRPDGHFFLPNHPTEEVFTSPDARRTEGRAACTRPVQVLGAKVEGAWFEFEGGVVKRFGAAKNEAVLASYLETDAGARRLGEAALVDASGAIFRSGLVFDNALIDENAASHIALGSSYADVFEEAEEMDAETKAGEGFNESMVHYDFMIGSEAVEVSALDHSGRTIDIIRNGRFVI